MAQAKGLQDGANAAKAVGEVDAATGSGPDAASAAEGVGILVNGEPRRTRVGDLAAWVTESGLEAGRVATAVNGAFVARDRRSQQPLCEGDRIDVFQAIVGG